MKKFLVEVGQVTGHLQVIMGLFRIEARNAEDAFTKALKLAEDFDIYDPIVISIKCEEIIFVL